MSVNLSKTKIIVFRKGGFLGPNEKWWFGNKALEVVNHYKYFGMHFSTKLSLTQTVSVLATKARTAQILRCLWRLGQEVFFKIYNAQILPKIMYGSELWGYQRFKVIEKAHLFVCLQVGPQTPNSMVLGDPGRFPPPPPFFKLQYGALNFGSESCVHQRKDSQGKPTLCFSICTNMVKRHGAFHVRQHPPETIRNRMPVVSLALAPFTQLNCMLFF